MSKTFVLCFYFFSLFVIFTFLAGKVLADPHCTQQDLDDAIGYVKTAEESRRSGDTSEIDVLFAKGHLMDVQLCAHKIPPQEFCARRCADLAELRKLLLNRGSLSADYFHELLAIRKTCGN